MRIHLFISEWSDVVAFTTGGPVQPGQPTDHYFYISDSANPATGIENGITEADLAFAGLTSANILGNPTTVYLAEGSRADPTVTDYIASGAGGSIHYTIHSDPPEEPTPVPSVSWGRLKMLYR